MSTLFSGHYLRNRSTLAIGILGYIGIVQHKEHSPEVFHIPPGTPCIQDVSLLVDITAGVDFLGLCDKKVHINMCPILDGYGVMGIF
jgi:hypothetical protein